LSHEHFIAGIMLVVWLTCLYGTFGPPCISDNSILHHYLAPDAWNKMLTNPLIA